MVPNPFRCTGRVCDVRHLPAFHGSALPGQPRIIAPTWFRRKTKPDLLQPKDLETKLNVMMKSTSTAIRNLLLAWPLILLTDAAHSQEKQVAALSDRYGDPLPAGAIARLGTTRLRHGGNPQGLIFQPDGKALITWSPGDNLIRYWDVTDGKEIRSLPGAPIVAASVSGKIIFACAGETGAISVRDDMGMELHKLEKLTDAPRRTMVLSADGTILASCHNVYVRAELRTYPSIVLWNLATGKLLRQIEATNSMDGARVLLSADGGVLAIGGANGLIHLYDVKTGEVRHEFRAAEAVYDLAFTTDDKTLASRGMYTLQLWDLRAAKNVMTFEKVAMGDGMAFSLDDAELVVGSYEGTQVWNVKDQKLRHKFPSSTSWDSRFAVSPDGKTLASAAYVFRLWDLRSGKKLLDFDEPSYPGECLAFSPDGRFLAAGNVDHDYNIHIWDVKSATKTQVIRKHTRTVHEILFTPDGRNLISASADKSIRWWDVQAAKAVRSVQADDQVTSIALSADGALLASKGGGDHILLWNARSGDKFPSFPIGDHFVHRIVFGLGKRLLITTEYQNSNVRLWNFAERVQSCRLDTGNWQTDPRLAVSPDGRILATADKGSVKLWDLATGRERLRIPVKGSDYIGGIAFAPHGQVVAISAGETISLCVVATGKEVGQLRSTVHQYCLAFSPDGKKLSSLSWDATMLIWEVSHFTGEQVVFRRFDKAELERLKLELESEDAGKAHNAINALATAPEQAMAVLKNCIHPVMPGFEKEVASLIAKLDSDKFAVRDEASRRLEAIAEFAEPILRSSAAHSNLEMKRRIERILVSLSQHPVTERERTAMRALETLERIATKDSILYLEELSKGPPDAQPTLDAQAALKRIRLRASR
jgi:WD40 repeat protein